jgi:DNA repair protein RadC
MKSFKHSNGSAGGYLVGKKHSQGGIPVVNKNNLNQKIEVEGGEVVITAPAVADNKVRTLKGTNKQILSQINVTGGGVSFAKGGVMPQKIHCNGTRYNYGGKIMTDYDIVKSCGCSHHGKNMAQGGNIKNPYSIPSNPVSKKRFVEEGNKIARKMRSNKGYEILDSDPEITGSTWSSGGCYPFARSMQIVFGGTLVGIYDKGIVQHVMLNIGDLYLDSDGVSSIEKKLRTQMDEGSVYPQLKIFNKNNIGSIGVGSEDLVKRIVDFARSTKKKMSKGGGIDIHDEMDEQFPDGHISKTMPDSQDVELRQKEEELIEAIKTLQVSPKHPLHAYTQDPKAFLAFIQDQATGLNPQRTSVQLLQGTTPKLAFDSIVKLVGSEELVLQSIEILPEKTKEIIRKAWYNKIVLPLRLRRAVEAKKLESGGAIAHIREVSTDLSHRRLDYALSPNRVEFDKAMARGGEIRPYPDLSWQLTTVINKQGGLFDSQTENEPQAAGTVAKNKKPEKNIPEIEISFHNLKTLPNRTISSSIAARDFLLEIWDKNIIELQEEMCVLYLNSANKLIGYQFLSKGGITQTVADPRLIVGTAAKAGAISVIIAHNHPSGNIKPSISDEAMTRQINEALKWLSIGLSDSIIITASGDYYSFRDEGYLKRGGTIAKKRTYSLPTYQNSSIWPPVKKTISAIKIAEEKGEVLTLEQATNRINTWRARAEQTGKNQDNSKKIIISLFDRTGNWTKGYHDAGFITIHFDIQHGNSGIDEESIVEAIQSGKNRISIGGDILSELPYVTLALKRAIKEAGVEVVGLLSAPPCTTWASSGAHAWPTHDAESFDEVQKRYGWWAAKHFFSPTDYNAALFDIVGHFILEFQPKFYAAENPVGRLKTELRLPEPSFMFNPNNYGDPYTKKTLLWGRFNTNLPQANVEPVEGSKIQSKLTGATQKGRNARSSTPEGFAYAFFMANHDAKIERGQLSIFNKGGKIKSVKEKPKPKSENLATYKVANKTQRERIIEVFGEQYVPAIEQVLDDVIDLYPFKSKVRNTNGTEYLTIGASKKHDHYFYVFADGKIYLEQQFALFPAQDKKEEKPKKSLFTKKYANAFELNKAIENLLDGKKSDKDFTLEDKEFLKYYSGYGGLEKYGAEGKGLLYEYYTPSMIAEKMWGLAYKYGYNGGDVLEPASGIGEFIKYAPDQSLVSGYEINPYSKRICNILYPKSKIEQKYFEELFIVNRDTIKGRIAGLKKYDLVIGNPPYGEFFGRYAGMGEKSYTRASNYIDYFIFRGLDLLRPQGLLVFIVGAEVASGGKPFLSQQLNPCKREIISKSTLLDAYRLPNGVFERTDVLTDIIVLQKK